MMSRGDQEVSQIMFEMKQKLVGNDILTRINIAKYNCQVPKYITTHPSVYSSNKIMVRQ